MGRPPRLYIEGRKGGGGCLTFDAALLLRPLRVEFKVSSAVIVSADTSLSTALLLLLLLRVEFIVSASLVVFAAAGFRPRRLGADGVFNIFKIKYVYIY